MGTIDILAILIILLSILFALYRGLVRELLGIAAWILAGFGALYSYSLTQPLTGLLIENKQLAGLSGSLTVALTILIVMTLINAHVTQKLRQSPLSGLDRILGLTFGIFRALLLIAVIYIGASLLLSERQLRRAEAENLSLPYIQKMAGWVEYVIPENMKRDLKSYEQGKLRERAPKKIGIELKKSLQEELADYRRLDKESLNTKIREIIREEENP